MKAGAEHMQRLQGKSCKAVASWDSKMLAAGTGNWLLRGSVEENLVHMLSPGTPFWFRFLWLMANRRTPSDHSGVFRALRNSGLPQDSSRVILLMPISFLCEVQKCSGLLLNNYIFIECLSCSMHFTSNRGYGLNH